MKKKIGLTLFLILIASVSIVLMVNNKSKAEIRGKSWAIYFAPTSTRIAYGNKSAKIVQIDSSGNKLEYKQNAYPFSAMINYQNKLFYQNNDGINSINYNTKSKVLSGKNTVGYNMGDVLETRNLFYFLSNESFKSTYYSSYLIIGNSEMQKLHQIEGFIHAYGNDNESIYLLTSDMQDKYSLQIQKISINQDNSISIEKNNIYFKNTVFTNTKMIIENGYIYSFCEKEGNSLSILKISSETLQLDSINDLIKFNMDTDVNEYSPISPKSVFLNDDKIYYPVASGRIYSFNIITNEFKKEFIISDYNFKYDAVLLSYYSQKDSEIYFLYYDKDNQNYCICTYTVNGDLKDKIYLNNLSLKPGQYAHSFIKID